ncbi:hypothetical protein ACIF9R_09180 [Streptomyces sp. NPDC086080]|uniref:hypothetical protein n=1 Tax=Streptomyces sp. NPDC086080 TaxID=3365748 RepID=UPI0037D22BA1
MPVKDEPARRRYEKLVERLESLMRAALKPEYQGCYGQLILSGDDLAKLGELKDVRHAAREAGRRLGWKTVPRLVGERPPTIRRHTGSTIGSRGGSGVVRAEHPDRD